ncbi:curli production assembly/transport component CsgG [Puteibacter caeruleilacunae]|nr:curli production assembly/transport component CsgG [Puteibacter caeruleilacunae]
MISIISNRKLLAIAALGVFLVGCGPTLHRPLMTSRARLGPETPVKKELLALPEPQQKVVAAVYKFRDQTGQYKPSEMGSNWSTAVTQGATTILIRALEESNWFIPIERENLGNLLNERKIIRSSRTQYANGEDPGIPPLLYAGVILEGGIISYETNILTGGVGLRYFGVGGSGQYREDRVTVYLRAVSTSNGQVLKTVYCTKSLLSQEMKAGIFKYVKTERLLEAEVGFTYNEPTEMAVTEAIEKAVESMILEGVRGKLWSLKNPADSTAMAFVKYDLEKDANMAMDQFGRKIENDRKPEWVIGAGVAGQEYRGDYGYGDVQPMGELRFGYRFTDTWQLELQSAYGKLQYPELFENTYIAPTLNMKCFLTPKYTFSPYLSVGAGAMINLENKKVDAPPKTVYFQGNTEVGVEYLIRNKVGIQFSGYYNLLFDDNYDTANQGRYFDTYYGLKLGVNFYLGKKKRNNPKKSEQ